ncbi:MAG: hypothetical protein ABIF87_13925 [Pseudomonadota bacterium]
MHDKKNITICKGLDDTAEWRKLIEDEQLDEIYLAGFSDPTELLYVTNKINIF